MIKMDIAGIAISGVSIAVSHKWTSLMDLADNNDLTKKTIEKFTRTTGVVGRYDASPKQTASDFCYVAADNILKKKGINPRDVGLLIMVTMSPDYLTRPATACVLQYRLGLSEDCIAFDVNLGCSGFVYGINIATSLMKANNIENCLLLCGDTTNKEIYDVSEKKNNAEKMLFGDAGSAILLKKSNEEDRIYITCKTDGTGFASMINPYFGFRHPGIPKGKKNSVMDEFDVFNFSTSKAPELISDTMAWLGTKPDDYDCLALHQANLLIMQRIAKKTGFDLDKVLVSIDDFGNTSSASIPVSIVKYYGDCDKNIKLHLLMSGYGVGLSWGVIDAYINTNDIFPVVQTDEYFDDGLL